MRSRTSPIDPASLLAGMMKLTLMTRPASLRARATRCRRLAPSWVASTAPPLAAFAVARGLLWAASASTGRGWPGAADLSRHDTFLYLGIAKHGYTLFTCPRPGGFCGNAGWFPLFPLLVAPFTHAGLSGQTVGACLAALFQLATLVLLWRRFLGGRPTPRSVAALLGAAVFPGAVYLAAVFPISLLALLTLAAIAFASHERPRLAAGALALAAVTHPLGACAALAVSLAEASVRRPRRACLYLGAGAAGLCAVALVQWIWVGHPDAYLLVQRHYGHGGTSPVETLRYAKQSALTWVHDPGRVDLVPQLEVLLVALVTAAVVATAIVLRRTLDRAGRAATAFAASAWLVPLALGGVSLYRSDAVLLVGVVVARRLPAAVLAGFAVAAAVLGFEMSRLFFQGVLA